VQELEKYRDEALRLDRLNEQANGAPHHPRDAFLISPQLCNENQRLKTHGKCQEDDREFLVRQIVALKKENSRLLKEVEKAALSSLKSSLNTASAPAPPAASVTAADAAAAGESISKCPPQQHFQMHSTLLRRSLLTPRCCRYKDIVRRLRRLLDAERKNLREVRSEHLNALQSRTELESLLRMCLDDVKQDIVRHRSRSGEDAAGLSGGVAAMGREDRMKVCIITAPSCRFFCITASFSIARLRSSSITHIVRCWSSFCHRSALFPSCTTVLCLPECLLEVLVASQTLFLPVSLLRLVLFQVCGC
jgi:hypothetical protein